MSLPIPPNRHSTNSCSCHPSRYILAQLQAPSGHVNKPQSCLAEGSLSKKSIKVTPGSEAGRLLSLPVFGMPIDQHLQAPLFESRIATFMPDLAEPEVQKSAQDAEELWMPTLSIIVDPPKIASRETPAQVQTRLIQPLTLTSTMPRVPPQPLGRAKRPGPRRRERNAVVFIF
jgi:hypothetical protein